MRGPKFLFSFFFWVLIALLVASTIYNYTKHESLLTWQSFALIGVIVFLLVGDEYTNYKITREGIELQARNQAQNKSDTKSPQTKDDEHPKNAGNATNE